MSGATDLTGESDIAKVFSDTVASVIQRYRETLAAPGAQIPPGALQTVDLEVSFSKVGLTKKGFLWFSSKSTEQGITIRLATRIHVGDAT